MLLPYLNRPQLAKRAWLAAMISSGMILSWTVLLNTSVLGVDVMQRSVFPTLTAVGKVNLFDFIERLDAIVVFTLLITVFFKASIYLYAAVLGIADLFKLKTYRQILLPIGTIVIFLSLAMASSFSEQGEEGFLNHYLSLALLIVVPMLMLVVSVIRNHFTRK
jgi:spore germination protein KB